MVRLKYSAGIGLVVALLGSGGLQAAVLWDTGVGFSGSSLSSSAICDSSINCGTTATTAFDSFVIPVGQQWRISSFHFTDFFFNSPTNDPSASYTSTTWSVWSGDPLQTGKLVASGTVSGAANVLSASDQPCAGQGCRVNFTVNLASPVTLITGTYYVGFLNNLTGSGGVRTERAVGLIAGNTINGITSPLNKLESSSATSSLVVGNGWTPTGCSGNNTCTTINSAFDVQGIISPEPGTWSLLLVSMAGFGFWRRRSKA